MRASQSLGWLHRADQARKLGLSIIEAGRKAVASGSVSRMIAADIKFHELLYSLSGNPLISPAMDSHLTYTQRRSGREAGQRTFDASLAFHGVEAGSDAFKLT